MLDHGRFPASRPGHDAAAPARKRARPTGLGLLCAGLLMGTLSPRAGAQDVTPAPSRVAVEDSTLATGLSANEGEVQPALVDTVAPSYEPAAIVTPHARDLEPDVPPASGAETSTPGIVAERPAPTGPVVAPTSLNDLDAWIDYKLRGHLLALPQESRLFYRRALMLRASGGQAEALKLVRGAIKLDPGFVAPRLTLAGWVAFRDPGESLEQVGDIVRLARESFMIQVVTVANALYLVLQALFLAIMAIALVVVTLNHGRLRHGWMERLASFVTPETAGWWSWALLIGPYLAGLGPALPTLAFLGLLWPTARKRERALFVLLTITLAGVPVLGAALDRFSSPLHDDRAPFYGVPQLQTEPYSPELRAEVERRAAAYPDNPFLRFAVGWMAQRGGNLTKAESNYRATLELWPDDDRVLNNLGNTLAGQGRNEEAIAAFHRALAVNPRNTAAHFNLSQIYSMRFDFQTANEELARASKLDFDFVKDLQTERAETKWAGLADQWINPRLFWHALQQVPFRTTSAGALPPLWRTRIECSGWTYSGTALLVALGSLLLGWWFHRVIPVRSCGNCGRAI